MKIRYTPLDEAAEIIAERKSNEEIQCKLGQLTRGYEPGGAFNKLSSDIAGVYAEYVARSTVADIAFAKLAITGKLTPWWATYTKDIFTTVNAKKTDMLRPPLVLPKGQSTRSWIVESSVRQQPYGIGEFPTIYDGLTVSQFWDTLRRPVLSQYELESSAANTIDLSEAYEFWSMNIKGKKSDSYYPAIMGLYASRAVLFVDYDRFESFLPTAEQGYEETARTLGVEPVIVKFNPEKTEMDAIDGSGRLINQRQTDLSWVVAEGIFSLTALIENGDKS